MSKKADFYHVCQKNVRKRFRFYYVLQGVTEFFYIFSDSLGQFDSLEQKWVKTDFCHI
jgi:hypothetical protein